MKEPLFTQLDEYGRAALNYARRLRLAYPRVWMKSAKWESGCGERECRRRRKQMHTGEFASRGQDE